MNKLTVTSNGKPYDLRERLFHFACEVVRVSQKLHSAGPVASALSVQLVRASVSAASNAEEADDGSSGRDFRAKKRICLRELKESRLRLRVLRATDFLDGTADPLIEEARELVLIVGTIIRNSARNEMARKSASPRNVPSSGSD
jgi:four helix bundle protein